MDIANITLGIVSLFKYRFKILCYHNVGNHEQDTYTLSVHNFKEQMYSLKSQGYRVRSLKDSFDDILQGSFKAKTVVLTFDDALNSFYEHAFPVLEELAYPATIFVPVGFIGKWDNFSEDPSCKGRRIMSLSLMKEMKTKGISFGSHTVMHPKLSALSNSELESELLESKNFLIKELGVDFCPLAYPFGIYDDRVKAAARRCGYDCGLTFGNIISNYPGSDLFGLKREMVWSGISIKAFSKIINPHYDLGRGIQEIFHRKPRS